MSSDGARGWDRLRQDAFPTLAVWTAGPMVRAVRAFCPAVGFASTGRGRFQPGSASSNRTVSLLDEWWRFRRAPWLPRWGGTSPAQDNVPSSGKPRSIPPGGAELGGRTSGPRMRGLGLRLLRARWGLGDQVPAALLRADGRDAPSAWTVPCDSWTAEDVRSPLLPPRWPAGFDDRSRDSRATGAPVPSREPETSRSRSSDEAPRSKLLFRSGAFERPRIHADRVSSSLTMARSSFSSFTLASILAQLKSLSLRSGTMYQDRPSERTGKEQIRPGSIP